MNATPTPAMLGRSFSLLNLPINWSDLTMPRGFTSIRFHGGPKNGEVQEDVPCSSLGDSVSVPSGSGYTDEPGGVVGVFVDAFELPDNWMISSSFKYVKRKPVTGCSGAHYDFQERTLVERCRATTKSNTWCRNVAMQGKKTCRAHAKSQNLKDKY